MTLGKDIVDEARGKPDTGKLVSKIVEEAGELEMKISEAIRAMKRHPTEGYFSTFSVSGDPVSAYKEGIETLEMLKRSCDEGIKAMEKAKKKAEEKKSK